MLKDVLNTSSEERQNESELWVFILVDFYLILYLKYLSIYLQ